MAFPRLLNVNDLPRRRIADTPRYIERYINYQVHLCERDASLGKTVQVLAYSRKRVQSLAGPTGSAFLV